MAVQHTHNVHCKTLQNLPNLIFFGFKICHLATLFSRKEKESRHHERFLATKLGLIVTRVTRLGEFSPIRRLFSFSSFLKIIKIAQKFELLYSTY
jgi:hypothetical protein